MPTSQNLDDVLSARVCSFVQFPPRIVRLPVELFSGPADYWTEVYLSLEWMGSRYLAVVSGDLAMPNMKTASFAGDRAQDAGMRLSADVCQMSAGALRLFTGGNTKDGAASRRKRGERLLLRVSRGTRVGFGELVSELGHPSSVGTVRSGLKQNGLEFFFGRSVSIVCHADFALENGVVWADNSRGHADAVERITTRKKNMQVKLENGNLVITIPMQTPSPSGSGKTLIVATSGGNKQTDVMVNGKNVTVGVNAYIKAT